MMKLFIILLTFGVFVSAIKQVKYQLPPERVERIKKVGDKCAAELKLDPKLFAAVADDTAKNVDEAKNYLYCILTNLKLVDDGGHVFVDKLANILGDNPFLEQFKEALHKCNIIIKENPVETLAAVQRCYFDTSPVMFVF